MTKLSYSSLFAAALFFAVGIPASADTLNGAGGSWQTWTSSTLATTGGPYWNNSSADGPESNIGWCLLGTGNCSMQNAPGAALPFFGNGNAAVSTMSFTTGANPITISLRGVFTSQSNPAGGLDNFGYYTVGAGGAITSPTELLDASQSLGSTATFTLAPNTTYGFYLENTQGKGQPNETDYWFYMDSTQDADTNGAPLPSYQHFAVFQDGSNYYIGIEDTFSTTGLVDQDYNDLILEMSTSPTAPEPASCVLSAFALLGFAAFLRTRKHAR